MDELIMMAEEQMKKSAEVLRGTLSSLRTGKASPAMLNGINVDYYGSPTPLNQISSVSVPEPRQLLIKPYDKNDIKNICGAINASDLGINPINEGNQIRLMIPALTEERRKDIVKQARKYGEEAKVAVRNVRREYVDMIKDDDSYTEDMQKRLLDDLQKVHDEAIKGIDNDVVTIQNVITWKEFQRKSTTKMCFFC